MISSETLDIAVRRGIITAAQNRQLADLSLALERGEPAPDEAVAAGKDEPLRLVGGGNDLFVTVGTVLAAAGLMFALNSVIGDSPMLVAALLAGFLWAVAEFVTRQKRMKLASTVLGLGFIAAATTILGILVSERLDLGAIANPVQALALRPVIGTHGGLFFAGVALAAIVYFLRFRVPVMAAVLAVAITGAAFLFATLAFYDGVTSGSVTMPALEQLPEIIARALYVPLGCGLLVFATAVALDLHDRERFTIWSDCAFWLHVVSAPLLVHPLFVLATGQDVAFGRIEPGTTASILLAVLIGAFLYVALAIDRRSLLIPTLAYFGTLGIYYLIDGAANTTGIPPFALILLVIGGMIIMFGAGWQTIRRLTVGATLPTSILSRLPPIRS